MFFRLGEAVKDAAETLRRAFKDQPSHGVALKLSVRPHFALGTLVTPVRTGLEALSAKPGSLGILSKAMPRQGAVVFEARLSAEAAWSSWTAGAQVAQVSVFKAERCPRLAVPPLPKAPKVFALPFGSFAARIRRAMDSFPSPPTRTSALGLRSPETRRGLDQALGLPIAVSGLDLREAPRALQMRYGMLAVKATGENVRNLELLGRYLIPRKGVRELRHDARTGRLMVLLGPEAIGAKRDPLLIARRKDDQSLITTFVEEG